MRNIQSQAPSSYDESTKCWWSLYFTVLVHTLWLGANLYSQVNQTGASRFHDYQMVILTHSLWIAYWSLHLEPEILKLVQYYGWVMVAYFSTKVYANLRRAQCPRWLTIESHNHVIELVNAPASQISIAQPIHDSDRELAEALCLGYHMMYPDLGNDECYHAQSTIIQIPILSNEGICTDYSEQDSVTTTVVATAVHIYHESEAYVLMDAIPMMRVRRV